MTVDENALEAAADAIVRMKLDQTAIYGPTEYARAVVTAYLSAAPSPAPDEVEAIARAICISQDVDPDHLFQGEAMWTNWKSDARAAIAAMRPTHALPSHLDNLHNRATLGLRMDGELYDVPERAAPKLSEEERARVGKVKNRHRIDEDWGYMMPEEVSELHSDRAFLLSLIDKLTEAG